MDGERERERCDRVLARCSTTLQLEEANANWFDHSVIGGLKSICLRGKTSTGKGSPWYLFIIPVDCLSQCFIHQQTQNNLNNNKKKRKSSSDILFNHSLRHTFPIHFQLTHQALPQKHSGLYDASWVVLGSTIYYFGSTSRRIFYLNRNVPDTTFLSSLRIKKAGRMITKRREPKVVALDGKIYVFSNSTEGLWGEVFEPYADSFEGQSEALVSPIPSTSPCDVSFIVAFEKEKKIVVGFYCTSVDEVVVKYLYPDIEKTTGIVVYVYDVATKYWVKHENILFLNYRSLQCQPIAVDNCLYWLDKKMWAYDLKTRQYYEGPIEDCFLQHVLETSKTPKYMASLLHLFGDFFCMTWGHWKDPILHCTMIQAIRTNNNLQANNRFELRTTVVSCQTFASDLSPSILFHALVL